MPHPAQCQQVATRGIDIGQNSSRRADIHDGQKTCSAKSRGHGRKTNLAISKPFCDSRPVHTTGPKSVMGRVPAKVRSCESCTCTAKVSPRPVTDLVSIRLCDGLPGPGAWVERVQFLDPMLSRLRGHMVWSASTASGVSPRLYNLKSQASTFPLPSPNFYRGESFP
jgi:hypothetical protein